MKTGFLVAGTFLSGGSYVIFEHAIRMSRHGNHEVFMIMDAVMDPDSLDWHPEARSLKWITFHEAENVRFDCVIATWWMTCYELYRFDSKAYLYFSQSVESRFYGQNEIALRNYADSTYLLGLNVITEATWIRDYLQKKYDVNAELVRNGIRKDIYTEDGPSVSSREKGHLRILVEGPVDQKFKNIRKTIDLCRKSKADEVWLLTGSAISWYPGVDRVISRIPIHKTPEVYRSCDVLVKLSYVEGMFGPPLEMFHCGGTTIVYDVTGHDEYIRDDYNGYVIETDNDEKVIEKINYLKQYPSELERLKSGARETARSWNDWSQASECFEKAVGSSCLKKQITRNALSEITSHFKNWYLITAGGSSKKSFFRKCVSKLLKKPLIFSLRACRFLLWKVFH